MGSDNKELPTQPSFIGKEIYLRSAVAEDMANYQHWFLLSEPQSMSCHPMPILTPAEAVEKYKKKEKSENDQRFIIVRIKDNQPLGIISFFNMNSLNRSAELGIIIDPDERKNGYAVEALKLLISYLFKFRNLNKVYAETADYNSSSIRLLESVGFKLDGRLRNHHYFNDEYHDKLIYSFLRFELDW
jgi:RimJ/RimL family protein N-acetyltransferase